MTVDEIKRSISMFDLVGRYGIKLTRNNMCICPFHQDKNPSMKIYKDGYQCFSCGAVGDMFSFVQKMDNCDFKTAYLHLGGKYQHPQNEADKRKLEIERKKRERIKQDQERKKADLLKLIREETKEYHKLLDEVKELEPFTDQWCEKLNKRELCWFHVAMLQDELSNTR